MKQADGTFLLSASDLANHLGCRHLTGLDREAAEGRRRAPTWQDPMLDVLQERGFRHEAGYLEHLRATGREVVSLRGEDDETEPGVGWPAVERTRAAMRAGADVIVQADLREGHWRGRADVLVKVPARAAPDGNDAARASGGLPVAGGRAGSDPPRADEMPVSRLGGWGYEVVDTKLARETRAGTILQLCLYSDLVAGIQGFLPRRMHVVSPAIEPAPAPPFHAETFRVLDYTAYYRLVKSRLEAAVAAPAGLAGTYPEPVSQCDICRWWRDCDARRREDDHLCLVAGVSRQQRRQLGDWGIDTLTGLASMPLPLEKRPERGSPDGYVRVREQARVQFASRGTDVPRYELLTPEPERGLARLPEPSPGDLFFDLEGDPFVGTGGLEYLFGYSTTDDTYSARWAVDRKEEKAAFEDFIDTVMARWREHPDLHVYHFGHYDPAALKRLMGRYATREREVDRLLRGRRFVDLLAVVRQGLRVGVERYSIKNLEPLFGFTRDLDLREAAATLRQVERALELGDPAAIDGARRAAVESYNRDDCVAARRLRDWLEARRGEHVAAGVDIPRPAGGDGRAGDEAEERDAHLREVMERLTDGVPLEEDERTGEQQARWLLAHMLEYHWREEKCAWWEFFRLIELEPEELITERHAVAGLRFIGPARERRSRERTDVHRYTFPRQELSLDAGDRLAVPDRRPADERRSSVSLGTVEEIDLQRRVLDIKKTRDRNDHHPHSAFVEKVVSSKTLAGSLLRIAEDIVERGLEADAPYVAARELLLRRAPRLRPEHPRAAGRSAASDKNGGGGLNSPGTAAVEAGLHRPGESTVAAARRLAGQIDAGVLAIQGPPGSGKTYTGARMILDLVGAGKKVGVTALSHKVIRNLLEAVFEAADQAKMAADSPELGCVQKASDALPEHRRIRAASSNDDVRNALASGDARIGAGTAWLWARPEMARAVDVLFVDEAGQMPLASVLAVSPAAPAVVLLGDPRQLEQPQQGSHPEGTDVSALDHVMSGAPVMPADRGLFLEETWRLHPSICRYTSELFYAGELRSQADRARQALTGPTRLAGAGLWFSPVRHTGNQNASGEEADRVAELVRELTAPGVGWVDAAGDGHALTLDDVLVVVPYNAHLAAVQDRVPGARVGTVDKFQGQQAPVVVYSLASSSPDDAPRGMEFLYDSRRLNVATSRARCACILVASPELFEPDCRSPRQMQLANAFCRYLEMATTLDGD